MAYLPQKFETEMQPNPSRRLPLDTPGGFDFYSPGVGMQSQMDSDNSFPRFMHAPSALPSNSFSNTILPATSTGNNDVHGISNNHIPSHTIQTFSVFEKNRRKTHAESRDDYSADIAAPIYRSCESESGRILARTSGSTLLFRRWKECYWLHVEPATIVLFNSKDDMEFWREQDEHFPIGRSLRKKMIKKMKKEKSSGFGGDREFDCEPHRPPGHTERKAMKYSMADVHSKSYDRKKTIIHGFKVERWTSVGTQIAGAFGSADPLETKAIRKVIRSCLKQTNKSDKPKKQLEQDIQLVAKTETRDGDEYIMDTESVHCPSGISGMTGMSYKYARPGKRTRW
eukprot:scaffold141155_cov64-Attheya_sp.AAC.3